MSQEIRRSQCPQCAAKGRDSDGDNLVHYLDGGTHCFACGYHTHPSGGDTQGGSGSDGLPGHDAKPGVPRVTIAIKPLPERGISQETCRRYGYGVSGGNHYAPFHHDGKLIGYQVRTPDKDFRFTAKGYKGGYDLWGQHLFRGGGRRVIVTEGEIDCLSVYQTMSSPKWDQPVVSVPKGAQSAPKYVKENLDFLNGYEEVIFCFDNDEPGRNAAKLCAGLVRPGKARITHLSRKDPNEYVKAGDYTGLTKAIFESRWYRPDGILSVDEVNIEEDHQVVYPYKWDCLTKYMLGRVPGEVCIFTSGTGMGKSTITREQIVSDLEAGHKVGVLMLEETVKHTKLDLIGLHMGCPIRKIMDARALERIRPGLSGGYPTTFDHTAFETSRRWLDSYRNQLYMYNHEGVRDIASLLRKIEYLTESLECRIVYLDHITISVAGSQTDDERRSIDQMMEGLESLSTRTGSNFIVVSQLRRSKGTPFEEGGRPALNDLRGSALIEQTGSQIIAIVRNQQADTPEERNRSQLYSLKARRAGRTGLIGELQYDMLSGRTIEVGQPVSFGPVNTQTEMEIEV